MGGKMKKILLFIIFIFGLSANETLPTCELTSYHNKQYKYSADNETFVRFKEARFLDKTTLLKYAKKLKIDTENILVAPTERCMAGVYSDGYGLDGKEMEFQYKTSCDFWIEYALARRDYYGYSSDPTLYSVSWKLDYFKNGCKVLPKHTYFINKNGSVNEAFKDGICKTKECYYEKNIVVFVAKSNKQKYLYGAEVQYFRKPHNGERFIKLSKSGKILDHNTSSWACTKDLDTNLVWENKSMEQGVHNINNKFKWAKWDVLVNTSNQEKLCGFDDWRVPNNGEIYSVLDYNRILLRKARYALVDRKFFNLPRGRMWTSTSLIHNSNFAYHVRTNLEYAFYLHPKKTSLRVVLVRGKETIPEITGFKSDKTMNVE
jgi:hypothetical protein